MSERPEADHPELEAVFREEWGRLVGALMGWLGDLDLAEECVQDVLATALERWPFHGVPDEPGAWLMTAARRRALDHLRKQHRHRALGERLAAEQPTETLPEAERSEDADAGFPDERLRLVFTCCHPALPREGRVALTLRLLGGLTTREIARAFLVSESTAAGRIVRAKRAIRDRRIPYRIPAPDELETRRAAVLDVVYLVFNEGYAAREGEALVRIGLCDEAQRLAGLLASGWPDDPEIAGLRALMEFQASRHATRTDPAGQLLRLAEQDRTRWDRVRIERARRLLATALADPAPGPYALQAAIAACHATAARFEETDWPRIVSLYDALERVTGSPVVSLNRAVAVGMAEGAEAALALLDALARDERLQGYPLLYATRADFLLRRGQRDAAATQLRRALELTTNEAERHFLEDRLRECEA